MTAPSEVSRVPQPERWSTRPPASLQVVEPVPSTYLSTGVMEVTRPPGVLVMSRTTRDHNVQPGIPLPAEYAKLKPGDKATITRRQFDALYRRLDKAGAFDRMTVGGNGTNIAHRLRALRVEDFEAGNVGPVNMVTWGNGEFLPLQELDLTHPGMVPHVEVIAGQNSEAIVYPVTTSRGFKDRIILGTNPELNAQFVRHGLQHNMVAGYEYVVMNSLPGTKWAQPLVEVVDQMTDQDTDIVFTPGSPQLAAVRRGERQSRVYGQEDRASVLHAFSKAKMAIVNKSEISDLIEGKGWKPAHSWHDLLQQALDLGPEMVLVTNGRRGSFGATQNGNLIRVGVTRADRIVGTIGAGDAATATAAHVAASLRREGRATDKDGLVKILVSASAGGSFATERVGAHEDPPDSVALEHRITRSPIPVFDLNEKRKITFV